MKYEAIIFDLGGVLIDIDYNLTIDAFKSLGIENFDELFSQAAQTDLFSDFETGKISEQLFINKLLPILPENTTPNQVVHAWNALILNVPSKSIEILERLKKDHKLFMLSNTNAIHFPVVRRRWKEVSDLPIEHYFDKIYLSHEIGMRKPYKNIFQFVIEDQQLDPEKTLFIDDSIQHIKGAEKAGLKAYHLTSIKDLDQLFS